MKRAIGLALTFFASSSYGSISCEFSVPGEQTEDVVQTSSATGELRKTMGDFTFVIDTQGSDILAISIRDDLHKVSTQTIASVGTGPFAKPRQLSLDSAGRLAEVICW